MKNRLGKNLIRLETLLDNAQRDYKGHYGTSKEYFRLFGNYIRIDRFKNPHYFFMCL